MFKLKLLVVGVSLVSSPLLMAVEPKTTPNQIEEITVIGQEVNFLQEADPLDLGLSRKAAPLHMSVMTDALVKQLHANRIDDLLLYIPGVGLNDNGGETGESPLIRGFGSSTIFVDGLRLPARYGIPRFMLDSYERVEVIKGPAGADAGIAEFGGVMNLVTKKPQRDSQALVDVSGGNYGFRKVSLDATGAISEGQSVQYRLITAYEEAAEWRDGRPDRVPSWIIAPSLNWDYSDAGNILARVERTYSNSPQDRGVIYLEGAWSDGFAPREWSFHQSTSDSEREFTRASIEWNHQLNEIWSSHAIVNQSDEYRHLTEFRNADSEPSAPIYAADGRSWSGERTMNIYWADWREDYVTSTAQWNLTGVFDVGSVSHRIKLGTEYYKLDIEDGTKSLDFVTNNTVDIFNPDNNQSPDITQTDDLYTDTGGTTQRSVFGLWVAEWTSRWRTVVGVRSDNYERNDTYLWNGEPYFVWKRSSDTVSWRLGSSYDFSENNTAFIGISNAFQPQDGITRSGNPLDPIHGNNIELGVKTSLFDGRALWTNSIYYLKQEDIGKCDEDPSLTQQQIDDCDFSVLFGDASIRGFESEIQGNLTDRLSVSGGLAVMDSEITKTDQTYQYEVSRAGETFEGNQFANTPKWQASLFTHYLWTDKLASSLGVVHVADRYGNSGNNIELPAYTLVDLGISYQFTNTVLFDLFASNIFDETYYTAMQDSGDRADQVMVGQRSLIKASVRIEF